MNTGNDTDDKEKEYSHKRPVTLVLLLGGLPGAGKSTLAAALQDCLSSSSSSSSTTMQRVEYDGLEESLLLLMQNKEDNHHRVVDDDDGDDATRNVSLEERLDAWRKSRTLALEQLRNMLLVSNDVDNDNNKPLDNNKGNDSTPTTLGAIRHVVLMDDNYYLRSMRKQVFTTCQQVVTAWEQQHRQAEIHPNIAMISVWLDTPVSTCLVRNKERTRQVPNQVIERMAQQMEFPETNHCTDNKTASESSSQRRHYHWERVAWRLNGTESVECNVQYLMRQFSHQAQWLAQAIVPVLVDPQVELDRLARERQCTAASVRHSIDQALRRAVKVVATALHPKYARAANVARKQVLAHEPGATTPMMSSSRCVDQDIMQSFYTAFAKEVSLSAHEQEKLQRALLQDQQQP